VVLLRPRHGVSGVLPAEAQPSGGWRLAVGGWWLAARQEGSCCRAPSRSAAAAVRELQHWLDQLAAGMFVLPAAGRLWRS